MKNISHEKGQGQKLILLIRVLLFLTVLENPYLGTSTVNFIYVRILWHGFMILNIMFDTNFMNFVSEDFKI